MKSFIVELQSLLTVVAAVLDRNGVLLEANAGFLRLLAASAISPIGTKVARCFIQPNLVDLIAALDGDKAGCYHGLLTIEDSAGTARTLRGRAWRTDTGIRILAEYDIAELETLADAILNLNRESAVSQRSLIQANSAHPVPDLQASPAFKFTGHDADTDGLKQYHFDYAFSNFFKTMMFLICN